MNPQLMSFSNVANAGYLRECGYTYISNHIGMNTYIHTYIHTYILTLPVLVP